MERVERSAGLGNDAITGRRRGLQERVVEREGRRELARDEPLVSAREERGRRRPRQRRQAAAEQEEGSERAGDSFHAPDTSDALLPQGLP